MPVLMLNEAAALLPARGGLIGLDLGTKTIGVAASAPGVERYGACQLKILNLRREDHACL
jgi:RNase H-fold protein (predicted Holliday junction resolvase)